MAEITDLKWNHINFRAGKIKIYLVSGNHLKGTIEGFDNFVIILNIKGKQNMIYKHAISTVIF